MAKALQTHSLLGKRIVVSLGWDKPIEILQQHRQPDSNHSCWRLLGQHGIIESVFQDKEHEVCFLVEFGNGQLEKLYATHCRVD